MVEQLFSLVHREDGPISTFATREEADQQLARVLADEPSWESELRVEAFELHVAEPPGR